MKNDLLKAVESVTRKWTKQRKSEERSSRASYRRAYLYSDRVDFTDVADDILPSGYEHASGGGKYTVSQRQMYYACRDQFHQETGREITAEYFTNTILRRYLNRNSVDWKITADPRGTFSIPNTSNETRIPCGTIAIDEYLDSSVIDEQSSDVALVQLETLWPSIAPGQRYQAALYIEKEGFDPILKEARIAERFDIAVLSCKGQSVAAARKLVDHVCAINEGIPLFTVHDFDEAGFKIAECLTEESWAAISTDRVAYEFKNKINVVDFGLRLSDVREFNLATETFKPKMIHLPNATEEEVAFLQSGKRVELNAFTAPQFIDWLESKLNEHLEGRLVPSDEVLRAALDRAVTVSYVNDRIEKLIHQGKKRSAETQIPDDFTNQVRKLMEQLDIPWDVAVYQIAQSIRK